MPLVIDTIKALGANPVPMNFGELYTALEQKVVDGGVNPYDNIYSSKLYEVTKYLSITNHWYSPMLFLMSKKTMDSLSPDEQKIISEAALEAGTHERQLSRVAADKRLEELKKLMVVNVVAPQEIEKMRAMVKPVYDKWIPEFGADLSGEMAAQLAKMRGK
jgi:TRAP-type C4-dicarboxylate transport system substrate-binding protein